MSKEAKFATQKKMGEISNGIPATRKKSRFPACTSPSSIVRRRSSNAGGASHEVGTLKQSVR